MKITITNPKSSTTDLRVIETLENIHWSDYGKDHVLKPGDHIKVMVDQGHGIKIEYYNNDIPQINSQ